MNFKGEQRIYKDARKLSRGESVSMEGDNYLTTNPFETREEEKKNRRVRQLSGSSVSSCSSFTSALSRFSSISSSIGEPISSDTASLQGVRTCLLQQMDQNVTQYHYRDCERVKWNDRFIMRFIEEASLYAKGILTNQDVVSNVLNVLKWRKEYGVNDFHPKMFPKEYLESGILRQATLSTGDILICFMSRKYSKVDGWSEIVLKMLLWTYEQLEPNLKPDQNVKMFYDLAGCGWAQIDMKFILNGLPIVVNYYATASSVGYYYEIPWFFSTGIKLAMNLLPEAGRDRIKLLTKKNISRILEPQDVPDIAGGPLITSDLNVPIHEMGTIDTVAEMNNIKKVHADKFKTMLEAAKYIK